MVVIELDALLGNDGELPGCRVCLRQDCVNRRGGLIRAPMRAETTPTWVAPRATAPAASVYAAATWRDSRRASAPA